MWASYRGSADIARLLIAERANIALRDASGANALMSASTQGHAEIVDLLIRNRASVTACDNVLATLQSTSSTTTHKPAFVLCASGVDPHCIMHVVGGKSRPPGF